MSKNSLDQIKQILEIAHESHRVEFKRLGDQKKVVAKVLQTVVAMANASGGYIFLGIDDPEKSKLKDHNRILGIEESEENFDEILNGLQRISPKSPVAPESVSRIVDKVSNKTIAIIDVPKATTSFYKLDNKFWIRLNKSNQTLSYEDYAEMRYAKGFAKADQDLIPNIMFETLDTKWFNDWKKNRLPRDIEGDIQDILINTGLASQDEKSNDVLPYRAAVLLFAQFPHSLIADSRAAIRIFHYKGKAIEYRESPNLVNSPPPLEGPTIKLIEDAQEKVMSILEDGVKVKSGFENQYKLPPRVIKESITNAVIHRDYHQNKDIEIRLYDDRLEVINPGLFVSNITLSNIGKERAQEHRNSTLTKHLVNFPDNPNLDANEGVRAMMLEMEKANLYPPIYITWPTPDETGLKYYVKLRLYYEKAAPQWQTVKEYLEEHYAINNQQARLITKTNQVDVMSKLLKRWSDMGLLTRVNGSQSLRDYKYRLSASSEFSKKAKEQKFIH